MFEKITNKRFVTSTVLNTVKYRDCREYSVPIKRLKISILLFIQKYGTDGVNPKILEYYGDDEKPDFNNERNALLKALEDLDNSLLDALTNILENKK